MSENVRVNCTHCGADVTNAFAHACTPNPNLPSHSSFVNLNGCLGCKSLRLQLEEKERALTAANERAEKESALHIDAMNMLAESDREVVSLRSSLEKAKGEMRGVVSVAVFISETQTQAGSDAVERVRRCMSPTHDALPELFSAVAKLDAFQLEQLQKLLVTYRESLRNIIGYVTDEREEWYSDVVWNLTEDIKGYTRQSEAASRSKGEKTNG